MKTARRVPSQQRSRKLVETVLSAASGLIAKAGSDTLRMSEIAAKAGIAIGSLYQYFPDKGAIIRALAERYNEQGQECVRAALDEVRDPAGLETALERVVDEYYEQFLAEPVMRDIWSGVQADKGLQALDAADSRAHGERLAGVLTRLRPKADGAAVRVAITLDRAEARALLSTFKRMLRKALQEI
jgi:AcrR family transcriptional regulator